MEVGPFLGELEDLPSPHAIVPVMAAWFMVEAGIVLWYSLKSIHGVIAAPVVVEAPGMVFPHGLLHRYDGDAQHELRETADVGNEPERRLDDLRHGGRHHEGPRMGWCTADLIGRGIIRRFASGSKRAGCDGDGPMQVAVMLPTLGRGATAGQTSALPITAAHG